MTDLNTTGNNDQQFICGLIQSGLAAKKRRPFWTGSIHEGWSNLNTQEKGSIGTQAYQRLLEKQGFETKIISNQGDIKYRKTAADAWIVAEVKTAGASLKQLKTSNFVDEGLWYNQIRPQQKGWDEMVLIGIYPNHYRIFRKARQEWDEEYKRGTAAYFKGLSHVTGAKEPNQQESVRLLKRQKRNNFNEWECIYTNQEGDKL